MYGVVVTVVGVVRLGAADAPGGGRLASRAHRREFAHHAVESALLRGERVASSLLERKRGDGSPRHGRGRRVLLRAVRVVLVARGRRAGTATARAPVARRRRVRTRAHVLVRRAARAARRAVRAGTRPGEVPALASRMRPSSIPGRARISRGTRRGRPDASEVETHVPSRAGRPARLCHRAPSRDDPKRRHTRRPGRARSDGRARTLGATTLWARQLGEKRVLSVGWFKRQ